MASGNATVTYTGVEPSMYCEGETFLKDAPTHTMDVGVIGTALARDDFKVEVAGSTASSDESPAPVVESEEAPKPRAAPLRKKAAKKA